MRCCMHVHVSLCLLRHALTLSSPPLPIQLFEAFLSHFVASAKMLVLLASSIHAARTQRRLRLRNRRIAEQTAARRVAKHARRFILNNRRIQELELAQQAAAKTAALERYRERKGLHVKRRRPTAELQELEAMERARSWRSWLPKFAQEWW